MRPPTDFIASIDHLRVDNIARTWGDSPEIEWDAAITLAAMCTLAYNDDVPVRQQVLTEMGFGEIHPLVSDSMSGLVAMSNEVAVVVFRGTDVREVQDWLTNVNFRLLTEVGSSREIHTGFISAYDLFDSIVRKLLGSRKPKYVWVTGHSLGGAMAACCAYRLIQNGLPFTGIVTFGQPRIGNEALATYLGDQCGDRYIRFMNEYDPVPILPPCFGIYWPAYWHTGRRCWLVGGELRTTEGPTPYTAQAPGPGGSATTELAIAEDEGRSITEEEFQELQQQLKALQTGTPEPMEPQIAQSAGRVQSWYSPIVRFFFDRIAEHGVVEYLRQLNEFRLRTLSS